jgi:hypothetical protein
MTKDIFDAYVKMRNELNPYKETISQKWNEVCALSMQEFSTLLKTIPYKSDALFGVLDSTGNMDAFIEQNTIGDDCDGFARAWLHWGVHNGFNGHEMVVTTIEHPFLDAHVVTILNKGNNYYLCNYEAFGPFTSFDNALNDLKRWERYADGFISAYGIYQERLV